MDTRDEHDEEVRIASARPGSLTTCLGSNSEQVSDLLFGKLAAPRRVTRVRVTWSSTARGSKSEDGSRFTERVHHAQGCETIALSNNLIPV